jgi:hypothetical protein
MKNLAYLISLIVVVFTTACDSSKEPKKEDFFGQEMFYLKTNRGEYLFLEVDGDSIVDAISSPNDPWTALAYSKNQEGKYRFDLKKSSKEMPPEIRKKATELKNATQEFEFYLTMWYCCSKNDSLFLESLKDSSNWKTYEVQKTKKAPVYN